MFLFKTTEEKLLHRYGENSLIINHLRKNTLQKGCVILSHKRTESPQEYQIYTIEMTCKNSKVQIGEKVVMFHGFDYAFIGTCKDLQSNTLIWFAVARESDIAWSTTPTYE